jgi:hypothetical protein
MCPVITIPKKWDCSSWPFMLNLKDDNDLKVKLEKYFTQFSVVCCSIQEDGKRRLFFILNKKVS